MKIEPTQDAPLVLNMNAVQRVYQNVVVDDEVDEDDNEVVLKMQATKDFKKKLNAVAHRLLTISIQRAVEDGRNTIWVEDLPEIQEV